LLARLLDHYLLDHKRNHVLFWNQKYVMDAELTPKFSGKVVAKFCAKYLHQQVVKSEAYIAGDIGTSLRESFFRLEEKEWTSCLLLKVFLVNIETEAGFIFSLYKV